MNGTEQADDGADHVDGLDDDGSNVVVVDPDDYQRTKKLESIHKARNRVRRVRNEKPMSANSQEWRGYHTKLAEAVADYGTELLPILEDAIEHGDMTPDDLAIDDVDDLTVIAYVRFDGRIPDHEAQSVDVANPDKAMAVFRHLDRLLRKLGLGLELKQDRGPAQI